MKLTERERDLVQGLASFEIIDAHEHLGPEEDRLAADVDVFTLFSHYTRGDLAVAGMSAAQYDSLFNRAIPLERRWDAFAPYWEHIRWGSYARAALLAAEKFYGFDDINETTCAPLSKAIRKNNTPGLYERVLKDACNIRTALTQCARSDLDSPLLTPVMPLVMGELETWDALLALTQQFPDITVHSLDSCTKAVLEYMAAETEKGVVGFKMMSNPYSAPNREEAVRAFESLHSGAVDRLPSVNPLRDYVIDRAIGYAGKLDAVVCVHTGYWGDFRQLDPVHMIPMLERHPTVRFDIYHLGYPWMR